MRVRVFFVLMILPLLAHSNQYSESRDKAAIGAAKYLFQKNSEMVYLIASTAICDADLGIKVIEKANITEINSIEELSLYIKTRYYDSLGKDKTEKDLMTISVARDAWSRYEAIQLGVIYTLTALMSDTMETSCRSIIETANEYIAS